MNIKSYLVQMVRIAPVNNNMARNHSPKIFAASMGTTSQILLTCNNVSCLVLEDALKCAQSTVKHILFEIAWFWCSQARNEWRYGVNMS